MKRKGGMNGKRRNHKKMNVIFISTSSAYVTHGPQAMTSSSHFYLNYLVFIVALVIPELI
jgi:hypothetical protein